MAKKKAATKSKAKAGKRRSAAKPRLVPFVETFDPTPYLVAARHRKLSAAARATTGEVSPPLPLSGAAVFAGDSGLAANPFVLPAPVPVKPTVYPDSPDGTPVVHNHFTINIGSIDYKNFNIQMDALVKQMQTGGSNAISGDVYAQLLSEMTAGRDLLKGSQPSRDLIDLLLVRPLKWLAEKAAGAAIGKLAGLALDALLKLLM